MINLKQEPAKRFINIMKKIKLPSQHQINDKVVLNFEEAGIVNNASVIKVHFSDRKVLYDVEIKTGDGATRIYNVDSCYVKK